MVIGMTLSVKTCGHSGELICHSAVPSVRRADLQICRTKQDELAVRDALCTPYSRNVRVLYQ
jgi:hypothetical protein